MDDWEFEVPLQGEQHQEMFAAYNRFLDAQRQDGSRIYGREVIGKHVPRPVALAFAHTMEDAVFEFEYTDEDENTGTLYFYKDLSRIHGLVTHAVACRIHFCVCMAGVFSVFGLFHPVLLPLGRTTCSVARGFADPDSSFWCVGEVTSVIQVAYEQHQPSLCERMAKWTRPNGPSRVTIGVKVSYPTTESVEAFIQLSGQTSASAGVQFGAHSACISPGMYDYQLFLPVEHLLHGLPWWKLQLISAALCIMTVLYSCLWGGLHAVMDMLCFRRHVWDVVLSCSRAMRGPW
eukprot:CAMPEP_0202904336 /NCGR_PEP_ID=MMETSP1392-20130828/28875_1 /ASSEMBLY_ACC=CAM_ASM_000868 /TAXON_ID=225041 /ORGANISM="Chlamydomonas chlamydogama, Strain SAG 11-48b" /LENGTH=289 /DNA_ID=CAMNT_0049591907 /DNA_START=227 /DNA_END=1093 /DNA_ORIENTATION=+